MPYKNLKNSLDHYNKFSEDNEKNLWFYVVFTKLDTTSSVCYISYKLKL